MATDIPSSQPDSTADPAPEVVAETPAPTTDTPPQPRERGLTRASAAWVATGAALLLLILLIVFILQNSTKVEINFLGWTGTISVGMGLLIAAVAGGVLVAISGVARVMQLRRTVRRAKRDNPAV